MADGAGVEFLAAVELQRYDVKRSVPVGAAGLGVDRPAVNSGVF